METEGPFTIDESDGTLAVWSDTGTPLDFEKTASYSARVTVSDCAGNAANHAVSSASVGITIQVFDFNDNTPVFTSFGPLSIQEELPAGTEVGYVAASDLDSGLFGKVSFSLTSDSFTIDENSGMLRTTAIIDRDRDEQDVFLLKVTASDAGSPAKTMSENVLVAIVDINDNEPIFTDFSITSPIEGNVADIGTQVVASIAAIDADTTSLPLTYSLVDSEDAKAFSLTAGVLTAVTDFDRETQSTYKIEITVADANNEGSTTKAFEIEIADVNDNSPIFSSNSFEFTVPENDGFPSSNLMVFASDKDDISTANGKVTYSTPSSVFSIDAETGKIALPIGGLDHEGLEAGNYTFVVVAQDGFGKQDKAKVIIYAADENDNKPIFQQNTIQKRVFLEHVASAVGANPSIKATDADSGHLGFVQYSLLNYNSIFAVNRFTGALTVVDTSKLDRESTEIKNGKLNLQVQASDLGKPEPNTAVSSIEVEVRDVNDVPPKFSKSWYSVSVTEGVEAGHFLQKVTAISTDGAENSDENIVDYSIPASSPYANDFEIKPDGSIFTKIAVLDRDVLTTTGNIFLPLVATDRGTPPRISAPTFLLIKVLDLKDTVPKITSKQTVYSIIEGRVGDISPALVAEDPDLDDPLTWEISGGSNDFSIEGGVLSLLRELDADSNQEVIKLNIKVTDSIGFTDSVTIFAYPLDVNDNAPAFVETVDITMTEDAAKGLYIDIAKAIDGDFLDVNQEMTFSITNGDAGGVFDITTTEEYVAALSGNAFVGRLVLIGELDRETASSYSLEITATNIAKPRQATTTTVVVTVGDTNDSPPVVTLCDKSVSVIEHSVGANAGKICATDADKVDTDASKLSFKLVAPSDDRLIIDATGQVSLKADAEFDHEVETFASFTVEATDGEFPYHSTSEEFTVTILDINDNPPVLSKNFAFDSIREDAPVGLVVGTIPFDDADFSRGYQVSKFKIVSTDPQNAPFRISLITGQVQVSAELPVFEQQASFVIKVGIENLVNSAITGEKLTDVHDYTITLANTNNNAPVFVTRDLAWSVLENDASSYFDELAATDIDGTDELSFSFSDVCGDACNYFAINSHTGSIAPLVGLDREELGNAVQLLVSVADGGFPTAPVLFAALDARVTVTILDVDDEDPYFLEPYTISGLSGTLLEGSVKGKAIDLATSNGLQIFKGILPASVVKDNDKAETDAVLVSFSLEGADNYFQVDSTSGAISAGDVQTDYDTRTIHLFKLVVSGAISGQMGSVDGSVDVRITIEDVNEHVPECPSSLDLSLSEDTTVGATDLVVSATDLDSGEKTGTPFYKFPAASSSPFDVDENTGVLTLKISIKDMKETIAVSVTVYDLDLYETIDAGVESDLVPTVCNFVVHVEDVNDPPSFPIGAITNFKIVENSGIGLLQTCGADGASICKISTAADLDTTAFGPIVFSMSGVAALAINVDTGAISIIQETFDFEGNVTYTALVTATDLGGEGLSASLSITFAILDANDLPPLWDASTLGPFAIPEETVGFVITDGPYASDGDSEPNNAIAYTISNNDLFSISATGEISVTGIIDRESPVEELRLTITATNTASPFHQASEIITIKVTDTNDNVPIITSQTIAAISEFAKVGDSVHLVGRSNDSYKVSGTDADIDFANTEIVFAIDDASGSFELKEGAIVVKKILSRNEKQMVPITITASSPDGSSIGAPKQVQIIVLSENTFSPKWDGCETAMSACQFNGNYSLLVDESTKGGDLVAVFVASDADRGTNADLDYTITNGKEFLTVKTVNNKAMVYLANAFDRDDMAGSFAGRVALQVSDKPSLASDTRSVLSFVSVFIRDENDEAPEFNALVYSVNTPESIDGEVHPIIIDFSDKVSDRDGSNLTLTIIGHDGRFAVEGLTVVVAEGKSLDHEAGTTSVMVLDDLVVQVSDGVASSEAAVKITVENINDNAPICEEWLDGDAILDSIPWEIEEEKVSLRHFGSCYDKDCKSFSCERALSYSIATTGITSNFKLQADGAPCKAAKCAGASFQLESKAMDAEVFTELFPIEVTVSDDGVPAMSTTFTVMVNVSQFPDNPPVFNGPSEFTFNESVVRAAFEFGKTLFVVAANDADSAGSVGSSLSYSLQQTNSYFDLESGADGAHISVKSYDSEGRKFERGLPAETTLVIKVTDGFFSDIAVVTVFVSDENDNDPVFSKAEYSYNVDEYTDATSIQSDLIVAVLSATDYDSAICGDGNSHEAQVRYRMAPVVDQKAAAHVSGLLDLDEFLGTITIQKANFPKIDTETFGTRISMELFATDCGTPVRTSQSRFVLNIENLNDNTCKFDSEQYLFSIAENLPSLTNIGAVTATDKDFDRVYYSIKIGDGFIIDDNTGEIFTEAGLDREKTAVHDIVVEADDGQGVRVCSTIVTVTVLDTNDESPKFSASEYKVNLYENYIDPRLFGASSQLQFIFATDADVGENERIEFALVDGDDDLVLADGYTLSDVFELRTEEKVVNNIVRNIVVLKMKYFIDRETAITNSRIVENAESGDAEFVRLTVSAFNPNDASKNDTATLLISVLDVNDESPDFTELLSASFSVSVPENVVADTRIPLPVASDPDFDAKLEYTLLSCFGVCPFVIDKYNGDVVVDGSFDRETRDEYAFVIVVYDVKGKSTAEDGGVQAVTLDVTLKIQDVNDVAPFFYRDFMNEPVDDVLVETNGSVEVLLGVGDLDTGLRGIAGITFAIQVGRGSRHFTLVPTAESSAVMLTGSGFELDREVFPAGIDVIVTASDGGNECVGDTVAVEGPCSTSISIHFEIGDLNDNIPVFSSSAYMEEYTLEFVVDGFTAPPAGCDTLSTSGTVSQASIYLNGDFTAIRVVLDASDDLLAAVNGIDIRVGSSISNSDVLVHLAGDTVQQTISTSVYENDIAGWNAVANFDGDSLSYTMASRSCGPGVYERQNVFQGTYFDTREGEGSSVYGASRKKACKQTGLDFLQTVLLDDDLNVYVSIQAAEVACVADVTIGSLYGSVAKATASHLALTPMQYTAAVTECSSISGVGCAKFSVADVVRTLATDADTETNGNVTYSFASGSACECITARSGSLCNCAHENRAVFQIDTASGVIVVSTGGANDAPELNRERTGSYMLEVVASDGKNTETTTVVVSVIDSNDQPVNCTGATINVLESTEVNDEVVTDLNTMCNDADQFGEFSTLSFEIYKCIGYCNVDVNKRTGAVTLNTLFDMESATDAAAGEPVVLTLQAKDGVFTSTFDVVLVPVNVNDEVPMFAESAYVQTISECASEDDATGLAVEAADADASDNSIEYTILESDFSAKFTISKVFGDVSVSTDLKGVDDTSYLFTVQAADVDGKVATVPVTIKISDANDKAPRITTPMQSPVHHSLKENTIDRTLKFIVEDHDTDPVNTKVTFIVQEQWALDAGFAIHATSDLAGLLEIPKLDYETNATLEVTIVAVNDALGCDDEQVFSAPLKVYITVEDVNDVPPVFASKFTGQVSEFSSVGTTVATVFASDAEGSNGGASEFNSVYYSVDSETFGIDSSSGRIYVADPSSSELNYENDERTSPALTLVVRAYDTDNDCSIGLNPDCSGCLCAHTNVVINITDTNDNNPEFTASVYNVSVEEHTVTSNLITVTAFDKDAKANGDVTYSILNNDAFSITTVGGNGLVSIAKPSKLDFEKSTTITVIITASDRGSPPRKSTAVLVVTLTDANDHDPVFPVSSYSVTLDEHRTSSNAIQVTATDEDSGDFGRVSYSLESDVFSVSNAGVVSVKNTSLLDYETLGATFTVMITASDGGTPMRSSEVLPMVIFLYDINDNDPVLAVNVFGAVSEAATRGKEIARAIASDEDTGTNSLLRFSLSFPNDDTYADEIYIDSTGLIRLSPSCGGFGEGGQYCLDYETRAKIVMTVTVTDMGAAPRSISEEISIEIEDKNDNSPIFDEDDYNKEILETSKVGFVVAKLSATDPDGAFASCTDETHGGGSVNVVSISLIGGDLDLFKFDNSTNEVQVAGALVYKDGADGYKLVAQAVDSCNQTRTKEFTINLKDCNTKAPEFVTKMSTYDLRETCSGGADGQCTIEGTRSSDPTIQKGIGSVVATDGDYFIGHNSLSYNIATCTEVPITGRTATGNECPFAVSDNGIITLKFALDFDLIASALSIDDFGYECDERNTVCKHDPNRKVLAMTITATDNNNDACPGSQRLTSLQHTVNIVVENENDESPTMVKGFSFGSLVGDAILENTFASQDQPYTIGKVTSTDLDDGAYGDLTFSVRPSLELKNKIFINETSGKVSLVDVLDYDQSCNGKSDCTYEFTIVASDGGKPPLQTTSVGYVELTDVNDEPPKFEKEEYNFDFSEATEIGTEIGSVTATDSDNVSPNQRLTYFIHASGVDGALQIDPQTGKITLADEVDFEKNQKFHAVVAVFDGRPMTGRRTRRAAPRRKLAMNERPIRQTAGAGDTLDPPTDTTGEQAPTGTGTATATTGEESQTGTTGTGAATTTGTGVGATTGFDGFTGTGVGATGTGFDGTTGTGVGATTGINDVTGTGAATTTGTGASTTNSDANTGTGAANTGDGATSTAGTGATTGSTSAGTGPGVGDDYAQEPGDDYAQEPGDDFVQEPGDDSAQEPGDDSAQEPGDDFTQGAGDDSAQEPGDDSAQEPGDDSTQGAGDDSAQEPGDDSTQEAGDDSAQEADDDSPQGAGDDSAQEESDGSGSGDGDNDATTKAETTSTFTSTISRTSTTFTSTTTTTNADTVLHYYSLPDVLRMGGANVEAFQSINSTDFLDRHLIPDFECGDEYECNFALVNITFTVKDVNDNNPIFSSPSSNTAKCGNTRSTFCKNGNTFKIPIEEGSSYTVKGTQIFSFAANDADSGDNGRVLYSVSPSYDGLVVLEDGSLAVTKPFDFDAANAKTNLKFDVIASDRGFPTKTVRQAVEINIVNINDIDPQFEGTTQTMIETSELAHDQSKCGANEAAFCYNVISDQIFIADGDGAPASYLAANQIPKCPAVQILGQSVGGDLPTAATEMVQIVKVQHKDANGVLRSWSSQELEYLTVRPPVTVGGGYRLLSTMAYGDNSAVEGGHMKKWRGSKNQNIKLDIDLQITDCQLEKRQSRISTFVLEILDENNHAPVFEMDSYSLRLEENGQILFSGKSGSRVLQPGDIKATDDEDVGESRVVTYTIRPKIAVFRSPGFIATFGNVFDVDATSGLITLANAFPYSYQQMVAQFSGELAAVEGWVQGDPFPFRLTVTATDGTGESTQETSVLATIYYEDSNDNAPVIAGCSDGSRLQAFLVEGETSFRYNNLNSDASSMVLKVDASDADSVHAKGQKALAYKIVHSNRLDAPFDINSFGVISVGDTVDYEGLPAGTEVSSGRVLTITSSVFDGIHTVECEIDVTVQPANEYAPVFHKVEEHTGEKRLFSASTLTTVGVIGSRLKVTFDENQAKGTKVLTVCANDDKDENMAPPPISFLLAGNSGYFEIEASKAEAGCGILKSKSKIDFDVDSTDSMVNLEIMAVETGDDGAPQQRSSLYVSVEFKNLFDEAPRFSSDILLVTDLGKSTDDNCKMNAPYDVCVVGTIVLDLAANTIDADVDDEMTYTLSNVKGSSVPVTSFFDVSGSKIRTAAGIDFEATPFIEFDVKVTDLGGASATAKVRVQIYNVNDNKPLFGASVFDRVIDLQENTNMFEDATASTLVASDADTNTPVFQVVASTFAPAGVGQYMSDKISLEANTGKFVVDAPVDFEGLSVFFDECFDANIDISSGKHNRVCPSSDLIVTVTVMVSDGVHNSTANIHIKIYDTNEYKPQFNIAAISSVVKISEVTQRYTNIFDVMASDHDGSPTASNVQYSIYSCTGVENCQNMFEIAPRAQGAISPPCNHVDDSAQCTQHVRMAKQVVDGFYQLQIVASNSLAEADDKVCAAGVLYGAGECQIAVTVKVLPFLSQPDNDFTKLAVNWLLPNSSSVDHPARFDVKLTTSSDGVSWSKYSVAKSTTNPDEFEHIIGGIKPAYHYRVQLVGYSNSATNSAQTGVVWADKEFVAGKFGPTGVQLEVDTEASLVRISFDRASTGSEMGVDQSYHVCHCMASEVTTPEQCCLSGFGIAPVGLGDSLLDLPYSDLANEEYASIFSDELGFAVMLKSYHKVTGVALPNVFSELAVPPFFDEPVNLRNYLQSSANANSASLSGKGTVGIVILLMLFVGLVGYVYINHQKSQSATLPVTVNPVGTSTEDKDRIDLEPLKKKIFEDDDEPSTNAPVLPQPEGPTADEEGYWDYFAKEREEQFFPSSKMPAYEGATGGGAAGGNPYVAVGDSKGSRGAGYVPGPMVTQTSQDSQRDGYRSAFGGTARTASTIDAQNILTRLGEMERRGIIDAEFAQIKTDAQEFAQTRDCTFLAASEDYNKRKNRYINICPLDATRVKLSHSGTLGGDYINANHVSGWQTKSQYVATQGPIPSTIHDFWRMVWEEKVGVVVMVTNLKEKGKVKCHQYWPDENGSIQCGTLEVMYSDYNDTDPDITVRKITLRSSVFNETREVVQFQVKTWPDQGVPASAHGFLQTIHTVRAAQAASASRGQDGPIVTHCSAGVGRTGTFIAVDTTLRRLLEAGNIDLMSTVSHMRQERTGSVQTIAQYRFCYEAIREYVLLNGVQPTASAQTLTGPLSVAELNTLQLMAGADKGEPDAVLFQQLLQLSAQ
jgi:protein tyrosine phosphatase